MDYDYETIEAKMKSLPDDLQEAMTSFDTVQKVEEIGKKYNLRIDQIGALGDVTSYVMLGLVSGKNFISVLSKKAEVDEKTAGNIAQDVNSIIFDGIRESIRKIEEKETAGNADLEAAGITVDKNQASDDIVSGNKTPPSISDAAAQISKTATLNAIENPPPTFINRLLTSPAANITETVVKNEATPAIIPPQPGQNQTSVPATPKIDPYREPIE